MRGRAGKSDDVHPVINFSSRGIWVLAGLSDGLVHWQNWQPAFASSLKWWNRGARSKNLNFPPFTASLLAVSGGGLFNGSWWSSVYGGGGVRVVWRTVVVGALAYVVAGWGCGSFSRGSYSLAVYNSSSWSLSLFGFSCIITVVVGKM